MSVVEDLQCEIEALARMENAEEFNQRGGLAAFAEVPPPTHPPTHGACEEQPFFRNNGNAGEAAGAFGYGGVAS